MCVCGCVWVGVGVGVVLKGHNMFLVGDYTRQSASDNMNYDLVCIARLLIRGGYTNISNTFES